MSDFDRINKRLNKWLLQSILLLVVVLVFGGSFAILDKNTSFSDVDILGACVFCSLWFFLMTKIKGDSFQ